MGLVSRALAVDGIATVCTSWNRGNMRRTKAPRMTLTNLVKGASLGAAGDSEQQLRVLRATLTLLNQDAPLDPVRLDENMPD